MVAAGQQWLVLVVWMNGLGWVIVCVIRLVGGLTETMVSMQPQHSLKFDQKPAGPRGFVGRTGRLEFGLQSGWYRLGAVPKEGAAKESEADKAAKKPKALAAKAAKKREVDKEAQFAAAVQSVHRNFVFTGLGANVVRRCEVLRIINLSLPDINWKNSERLLKYIQSKCGEHLMLRNFFEGTRSAVALRDFLGLKKKS